MYILVMGYKDEEEDIYSITQVRSTLYNFFIKHGFSSKADIFFLISCGILYSQMYIIRYYLLSRFETHLKKMFKYICAVLFFVLLYMCVCVYTHTHTHTHKVRERVSLCVYIHTLTLSYFIKYINPISWVCGIQWLHLSRS